MLYISPPRMLRFCRSRTNANCLINTFFVFEVVVMAPTKALRRTVHRLADGASNLSMYLESTDVTVDQIATYLTHFTGRIALGTRRGGRFLFLR